MIVFLLSIGTLILVLGLVYRPLRLNKRLTIQNPQVRGNGLIAFLDRICQIPVVTSLIGLLTKNKSWWLNRMLNKELELSETGMALEHLYAVKLLSVLICIMVILGIRATNIEQQKKYIIATSSERVYEQVVYDEERYTFYSRISEDVEDKLHKNQKDKESQKIVEAAISQRLKGADKASVREKASWFLQTREKVDSIGFINYKHVLITAGSFLISDFILLVIWLLRGYSYKRELIKLEYILELLAGIDGIKTSEIVLELQKASHIYRKSFAHFLYIFKSDKRQAFNYLKSSARNTGMAKLAEVLEIYSLTDKTIAMQILERAAMERDEAAVITADETLDIVDLIAFVSVVPLIYEIAHLMLSPMLDVIYRAFQYI